MTKRSEILWATREAARVLADFPHDNRTSFDCRSGHWHKHPSQRHVPHVPILSLSINPIKIHPSSPDIHDIHQITELPNGPSLSPTFFLLMLPLLCEATPYCLSEFGIGLSLNAELSVARTPLSARPTSGIEHCFHQ